MEEKLKFPLNLQLFAEEVEGATGDDTGTDDEDAGTDTGGAQPTGITEEQVQAMIAKAREGWTAEQSEAQKLAKMSKDEKAAYNLEKQLATIEEREKNLATKELKATAVTQLIEKGLSAELADILDLSNAEACKTSIDAVEKAISAK